MDYELKYVGSFQSEYDLLEEDYEALLEYIENANTNTGRVQERIEKLGDQYNDLTSAYETALEEKGSLDEDNDAKDTIIESYSGVSTMSEKCMIGPIFGFFWYCREGEALVRDEDEAEAEEEAE